MRRYPTYLLSQVPITGTIAKLYQLAVETQTDEEYEIVCRALQRQHGSSLIDTLHHLPKSLSPHWAIYTNPQSQYLIFLGSEEDRNFAVNALWSKRK
jgi:hypothetical protein